MQRTSEEKEDDKDDIALTIFGLIESLDFHVGRTLLANILIGSKSKKAIDQKINKLKHYGMFREYRHKEILEIIDQLIDKGYLAIRQSELTNFPRPLLYLTDLSKSALINKEKIELEVPIMIKYRTPISKNPEMLNKLKRWRKKVANEKSIPAFCIFHDKTLIEISNSLPITKQDLMNTYGFGRSRLKDYGDEVLEIVREYKPDKQSIRNHNEVVFEEGGNKSTSKSFRAYDLGKSDNPVVIPELIHYIDSKNANERRLSASALGKLARFKPEIYGAIHALTELLNDEKPQVRQYAVKALGKIGHPITVKDIEKLLSDEKEYNREAARYALRQIMQKRD
ncbi:MAG: HRDC domain-containing protein [Candidatus Altiarchaeales archaeon]|nr:HRDC domain-containing protein [Candidatus Altiarchaeota archaeon]MBU4406373.1 HRDC domain-containing protein [Candidatus Altiarchaeota archaeon]MBU4437491.1 HRDC domain-containing protein [Candidatus Altiarchaeota archaeon]MCG2782411.1 HRDC domain-containing protein [Candidatus Altiarchaeales archaeon]